MKSLLYGRSWLQPFFEKLHTLSLGGMNFGCFDVDRNGELALLERLKVERLQKRVKATMDHLRRWGQSWSVRKEVSDVYGSTAHLFAFEPSPLAFQHLSSMKHSLGQFKAFNLGFHHCEQERPLYASKEGSSGASLFKNQREDLRVSQQVTLTTLDAFCFDEGVSQIDLLKIDTEGNELNVLLGATRLLGEKRIARIQFEFGEKMVFSHVTFWDLWHFFQSHGYRISRVCKDGLRPIPTYSPNLEVYTGGNFVASLI